MRTWPAAFCLALAAPVPVFAQEAEPEEVIITGMLADTEIVIEAPRGCYERDGDPYDTVPVGRGVGEQRVIGPDANGVIRWHEDDQPILGPAIWQRTGNAIGDYRYRVPAEADKPMCIGARGFAPLGHGGLRRIVPADGTHGRYLHFSARVSTRNAGEVRFYLVAGDEHHRRGRGGDTRAEALRGTNAWRRVHLVVGPVPAYANHVSYGFLLAGRGDAWFADPKLDILTREEALAIGSVTLSQVGNANPR